MAENEVKVGASVDLSKFVDGMKELVHVTQDTVEAVNAALASVSGGLSELGTLLNLSAVTDFMEHTKDQLLELDHLSETTHISVVHISELKDAMEEAGVATGRLPAHLTSLTAAMGEAAQGGNRQADAFRELGVNTAGWSRQLPDASDVLQQLAVHLQHSNTSTRDLANMNAIFGGGVEGLTNFLKANGDQLDAVTRKHLEHGLQLAASIDAAKKLNQAEAQLKADLETQLLPVFRLLVDAIDGLKIMYAVLSEEITFFGARAIVVAQTVADAFTGVGRILKDVFTGNFKAIAGEAHNTLLILKSDIATFNQTFIDQERETNAKIAEILKPKPQVPDGDKGNREDTKLQRAIQINIAKIEADKKFKDAEIEQQKAFIQQLAANRTIDAEQELDLNKKLINEKFQQDEAALQAKRNQLARDGARNRTQIIALDGEIKTLTEQNTTQLIELDTKYQKQVLHNAEEAAKKRAAELKELERKVKETNEINLESAKAHEEALGQLKQQGLDFELQLGRITQEEYDKRLQQELTATFINARKELELKRQAAQGDIVQQARVDAELQKLHDKFLADTEKAEQKSFLRRRQQFDGFFKNISQGFNTALNSWIEGTQTAAQAFTKMFQNILTQLISFVEQWIERKIEMWLIDKLLGENSQQTQIEDHARANAKQAESDASLAAAEAYTANAALGPLAAGKAAAIAFAAVSAMAVAAGSVAKFERGGLVPATGLALVHQGERILPASLSGDGSGLAGTGAVHVHMNIQTIDSASFKDTVGRHGHLIGDLVNKALKKKGIK